MIRPGEISLSSYGVLFLDELLEFPRSVLEVLRQPLEDGRITLSRASHAVTFPAQLSLVAALNPCPCGHYGQRTNRCTCSPFTVERYQSKLSGPLMDRIDLCVNVPPVNVQLMSQSASEETSASMREKVMIARAMQMKRFNNHVCNGKMTRKHIQEFADITHEAQQFLVSCAERLSMSARSFDRIIRVARTIADLEEANSIHQHHIAEALHYRPSSNFVKT